MSAPPIIKTEPTDGAGGIISQQDPVPIVIPDGDSQKNEEDTDMGGNALEILKERILCPDQVRKANKTVYEVIRSVWTKTDVDNEVATLALAQADANLKDLDSKSNHTLNFYSFMVSPQNLLVMINTIKKIEEIVEHAEDNGRLESQMIRKLELNVTALINLYRQYGIQWRDVTPSDDSKKVIWYMFTGDAPAAGSLRENLQLAFIEPTATQGLHIDKMLGCIQPMMNTSIPREYRKHARVLDGINKSIMAENVDTYHDQIYVCPPMLLQDALQAGNSSLAARTFIYDLVTIGVTMDRPELSNVERQEVRKDCLLGYDDPYSTDFITFNVSSRVKSVPSDALPLPNPVSSGALPNPVSSIDSDEEPMETEDEEESDDDETLLFGMAHTKYPEGSKTVGWGAVRGGKWYLNRIGPAAASMFREEDLPINNEDDEIDWDNPPQALCVTNSQNRKGEKRVKDTNKLKYTKRHIVGIYGVSYKATSRTPFPGEPSYEALNQKRLDKTNDELKKKNEKPFRFIGCHVRVGWKINGKIVKTWELRGALRDSSRWKKITADDAIYEAAKSAEERHENWLRGNLNINIRDPTPAQAYAEDTAQKGRDQSMGVSGRDMRLTTSESPMPTRRRHMSPLSPITPTSPMQSPTRRPLAPTSPSVRSARVTAPSPTSSTAEADKSAVQLAIQLEALIKVFENIFLKKYNVNRVEELTDMQQDDLLLRALGVHKRDQSQ